MADFAWTVAEMAEHRKLMLQMALDLVVAELESGNSVDAADVIEVAKTFEAYILGETK